MDASRPIPILRLVSDAAFAPPFDAAPAPPRASALPRTPPAIPRPPAPTLADRARELNDRADIARANRDSAELLPHDARRIFAVRVADALEGGQAAILTPAAREALMRHAGCLGLRPFDANLIIAIVQDDARQGGRLADSSNSLLSFIRPPTRTGREPSLGVALAAFALAAITVAALIRWLM